MRASLFFFLLAIGLTMAQTPGVISGFQMKSNGVDYIELEWHLVGGDLVIEKYSLVFDVDFSVDLRCPAEYCSIMITYLDSGRVYEFHLTPHFQGGIVGETVTTTGFTLENVTYPVENLRISDVKPHMFTIRYDPPSKMEQYVKEYDTYVINLDDIYDRVQLSSIPYEEKSTRIVETYSELEACTNYRVEVRTKSRQGLASNWTSVQELTGEDMPSEARNPQVKTVTDTSVTLLWFQPETNKRCAVAYRVDWDGGSETVNVSPLLPFAVEHVISGLAACTPYTFTVTAMSATLGDAPPVTVDAQTACY